MLLVTWHWEALAAATALPNCSKVRGAMKAWEWLCMPNYWPEMPVMLFLLCHWQFWHIPRDKVLMISMGELFSVSLGDETWYIMYLHTITFVLQHEVRPRSSIMLWTLCFFSFHGMLFGSRRAAEKYKFSFTDSVPISISSWIQKIRVYKILTSSTKHNTQCTLLWQCCWLTTNLMHQYHGGHDKLTIVHPL